MWIGDRRNDAAYHFIRERNAERQASKKQTRLFSLYRTPLILLGLHGFPGFILHPGAEVRKSKVPSFEGS